MHSHSIHLDDSMSTREIRAAMRQAPKSWNLKPGRQDGRDWSTPPEKESYGYGRKVSAYLRPHEVISLWEHLDSVGIVKHKRGIYILKVSHALRWWDENNRPGAYGSQVSPSRRRARVATVK